MYSYENRRPHLWAVLLQTSVYPMSKNSTEYFFLMLLFAQFGVYMLVRKEGVRKGKKKPMKREIL